MCETVDLEVIEVMNLIDDLMVLERVMKAGIGLYTVIVLMVD